MVFRFLFQQCERLGGGLQKIAEAREQIHELNELLEVQKVAVLEKSAACEKLIQEIAQGTHGMGPMTMLFMHRTWVSLCHLHRMCFVVLNRPSLKISIVDVIFCSNVSGTNKQSSYVFHNSRAFQVGKGLQRRLQVHFL